MKKLNNWSCTQIFGPFKYVCVGIWNHTCPKKHELLISSKQYFPTVSLSFCFSLLWFLCLLHTLLKQPLFFFFFFFFFLFARILSYPTHRRPLRDRRNVNHDIIKFTCGREKASSSLSCIARVVHLINTIVFQPTVLAYFGVDFFTLP